MDLDFIYKNVADRFSYLICYLWNSVTSCCIGIPNNNWGVAYLIPSKQDL